MRSKGSISPLPHHHMTYYEASYLILAYSVTDQNPTNRAKSTVLLWGGTVPALQGGAVVEGWGQLCRALSSLFFVVTGAVDLNADHGCGRTMYPDMAHGNSLSWMSLRS